MPEKIKSLRENSGLTQAELARRLGITRSSVNGWEMGLSVPSTSLLVELAKTFHVSTDFLLGLEGQMTLQTDNLTEREISAIQELISCFEAQREKQKPG